jgi:hypothetical protein
VADSSDRSANVRSLSGATLTGGASVYIFVRPTGVANVRRVSFTLDGKPFSVDGAAPYDFAGTSRSRACRACEYRAYPFESNLLTLGQHSITATIERRNGTSVVLSASFTIADAQPHALLVSTSPGRSAETPLEGAVVAGRQYVFLGPALDAIAGLDRITFRLDGEAVEFEWTTPYDLLGTRKDGSATALDTRSLRNGRHRVSAAVHLSGGGLVTYESTFTVSN